MKLLLYLPLLFLAGCSRGGGAPAPVPAPVAAPTPAVTTGESHEERYAEARFYRSHDSFLSADRPAVVSASDATFLADDDEVLGFVLDGQARCYEVRALCYHHVVNDVIGVTPIAVTY